MIRQPRGLALSVAVGICALFFGRMLHAETISINFMGGNSSIGATSVPAGIQAGVPGSNTFVANWNNCPGGSGTDVALVDSSGLTTGATVTYQAHNGTWAISTPLVDGNDLMWTGYIDNYSTTEDTVVTVSGLDVQRAEGYDVYVYFDGSNGTDWRMAGYTIGSTTYVGEDSENTDWKAAAGQNPDGYFQVPMAGAGGNLPFGAVPPGNRPNNNEGNYVVFSGLTDPQFTLTARAGAGGTSTRRAAINGIQIVGVGAYENSPYGEMVRSDNPVAYYRFEDFTGTPTIHDSAGGATVHDGAVNGGLTVEQPGLNQFLGTAGGFNGTDSRVRVPDGTDFDFGTGPYAIEMWFQTDSTARGDLFTYKGGTGADYGIHSRSQTGGGVSVYHNGYRSQTADFNNAWHHLVVTRDATGTVTTYLDGRAAASAVAADTMDIANDLLIGGNFNPTVADPALVFNGRIDEVAFYNASLSSEQIIKHIAAAQGVNQNGTYAAMIAAAAPVGYWPLGDDQLDVAHALIGGVNGQYVGAVAGDLNQPGILTPANDGAFSCDGSDNRMVVSNSVLAGIGTGDFSLELWFNKAAAGVRGDLFNLKGTGGDLGVFIQDNNQLSVWWDGQAIGNAGEVAIGQWQHLVLLRRGTGLELYLNGALYNTGTSDKDINLILADIQLGANKNPDGSPALAFNGLLDEFAVYDRALIPSEITLHAEAMQFLVPEPSAFCLLAIGLVGVGGLALRRRRG